MYFGITEQHGSSYTPHPAGHQIDICSLEVPEEISCVAQGRLFDLADLSSCEQDRTNQPPPTPPDPSVSMLISHGACLNHPVTPHSVQPYLSNLVLLSP